MRQQATPRVSAADVDRIVSRDYPKETREVSEMLMEYGKEPWEREIARVRLAVLKLAAGSIERLRREIETAKRDYRDVLASAEYPEYTKLNIEKVSWDEKHDAIGLDWRQYKNWLERQ